MAVETHYEGEVWGLHIFDEDHVITCGDDNRVMIFDTKAHKFVQGGKVSDKDKRKNPDKKSLASTMSKLPPNKQARAVAASMTNNHLVICNNLGKVSIRLLDNFDSKVTSLKHPQHYCEVAKYSPDESHLAIGSHDNHVYIYEVKGEEYHLVAKD